jgi:predicted N-acyltransferase
LSASLSLQVRFHATLDDIDAAAWNALLPDDNPFVDHAFLAGLERHGCVHPENGWQPYHIGLYDDAERLVAAAPLYLKGNSHGEFVFDWSWAGAYERHGLSYYPKLLCAVPYSPVTGPRLLVGDSPHADAFRATLIATMRNEAQRLGLSSAHLNFASEADVDAFDGSDWLPRFDWQFQWQNEGWRDFDAFLARSITKSARTSAANGVMRRRPAQRAKFATATSSTPPTGARCMHSIFRHSTTRAIFRR